MYEYTNFNGTAEEHLAWIKEQARVLKDKMNDNLLVTDEDGDCSWLDFTDGEVDTYETLDAISKFLIIVESNLVPDFWEHRGIAPDGFVD